LPTSEPQRGYPAAYGGWYFFDGYLPVGGELFEIIFYTNLVGQFDTITGRDLENDVTLSETYEPARLVVQATK
jgi:hypothetical protein